MGILKQQHPMIDTTREDCFFQARLIVLPKLAILHNYDTLEKVSFINKL